MILFAFSFAYEHTKNFFLAKAEHRRLKNVRADVSDWSFSPQIQICMLVVSKSKMMLELKDYATALSNDVIKTIGIGMHSSRATALCKFGYGNSLSCKSISCAMDIINVLFE